MARIDGPKYTGTLLIDLNPVENELRDLAPGALKGARGEQEGLEGVLKELSDAVPKHGDEAEIHPAVYQRVLTSTELINKLRGYELVLEKALEVCRETRGMHENNREDDLSAIGSQAEDKAEKRRNPGLLAHFEKTIAYKSQIADKAVGTRRKNEESKNEAAKKAALAGEGAAAKPEGA